MIDDTSQTHRQMRRQKDSKAWLRAQALKATHLHTVSVDCLAPSSPLRRKYGADDILFVSLFNERAKGAVFLEGLCVSIQAAERGGAWARIEYIQRPE